MNLRPFKGLFRKSSNKDSRRKMKAVDKWYEYSSMNDLYNPTLEKIKKLKAKHQTDSTKIKKKINEA